MAFAVASVFCLVFVGFAQGQLSAIQLQPEVTQPPGRQIAPIRKPQLVTVFNINSQRCKTPTTAPARIEKVITTCQDEIKIAILQEALEVLGETTKDVVKAATSPHRSKRETFTNEERRIAGCLLQCVYRKVKALDEVGFPTVPGLVQLYGEGVTERGYFVAIAQSVQQCLAAGHQKRLSANDSDKGAQMCDLAYNVFDCVSDQMANYCNGN